MKRLHMHCPYCGAPAVRRRGRNLFREQALDPEALYYVCSRYPVCNAYVSTHKASHLPMGTLADPALRRKRIAAHHAFDRLWLEGPLTKKEAYRWLAGALGIPDAQAHIACFSHHQCDKVIELCANRPPAGRAA